MLRRSAQAAGVGYLGLLLAACGDDDDSGTTEAAAPATSAPATSEAATTEAATSAATTEAATTEAATEAATTARELSGTITMMNYPGWMGKTTVADFKAATGVDVKEVEGLTSGTAAAVAQIAQNKDEYDMSLGGLVIGAQLEAGGLLQKVDYANIPNIEHVDPYIRESFPYGIPTDFGKVGIGYRKDLMDEQPASWADFWELSEKYKGKVTMLDYDVDILGIALLYKGFSVNSAEQSELEAARDALIELKPNLQAFLPTDFTKPLLQGTAVMAVSYDYDIAAAQKENENIVWVTPEEGLPAYMDGWLAIAGTEKLAEVEAFMNFLLEPQNYAGFINGIGASYVMPAAEEWIDPAIKDNPSLKFDAEAVKTIEFETFLGEEATRIRSRIWQEVKNA